MPCVSHLWRSVRLGHGDWQRVECEHEYFRWPLGFQSDSSGCQPPELTLCLSLFICDCHPFCPPNIIKHSLPP